MSLVAFVRAFEEAKLEPPAVRLYRQPLVATDDGVYWAPWEPMHQWAPGVLRWGSNGDMSTLTLRKLLGAGSGASRERPETLFGAPADRIQLLVKIDGEEREWFRGLFGQETISIQASPDLDGYAWVAYGPELLLDQIRVPGQWHAYPSVDDNEIDGTIAAGDVIRNNANQYYLPAVFNWQGRPNAAPTTWKLDDKDFYDSSLTDNKCRVFIWPDRKTYADGGTSPDQEAQFWTPYEAVRSLIEWLDNYDTVSYEGTDWGAIETLLSGTYLHDVDVTGMSLLAALRAILLPIGFGFALEPWAQEDEDGEFRFRLLVWSRHSPARLRKPALADISGGNVRIDSAEAERAQVQRLEFVCDNHQVSQEVLVIGDQYRWQVRFDYGGANAVLVPYWDTGYANNNLANYVNADDVFAPGDLADDDEAAAEAFRDMFNTLGSTHNDHRHVFRSFCLNEDGSANVLGHSIPAATIRKYGDVSDPDDAAGTTPCIRRPRPMESTFTADLDQAAPASRRIEPYVRMGIIPAGTAVDADSWIDVEIVSWHDWCGFTLAVEDMFEWRPWKETHRELDDTDEGSKYGEVHYLTALYNTIRDTGYPKLVLAFYGSIESDYTLKATGEPDVSADWPYANQRILRRRDRFVYHGEENSGPRSSNTTNTRDDSVAIAAYADSIAEAAGCAMGHGSVILKSITREYRPGDGIPETSGRVVEFGLVTDGSKFPIVVGVSWDFSEGANKTELVLDSPLASVMR